MLLYICKSAQHDALTKSCLPVLVIFLVLAKRREEQLRRDIITENRKLICFN